MILVIDNHDSFVHNLARLTRLAGAETKMVRNDECSVGDCLAMKPQAIILSPGPGRPEEAGLSMALIEAAPHLPILGVCLGHQAVAAQYGGSIRHAKRPLHGQASWVNHDRQGLFSGLSMPIKVGRYHSLIADIPDNTPLVGTAFSDEGELMALAHQSYPHYGVQFHPESLLSEEGQKLLQNFIHLIAKHEGSGA